MNPGNFKHVSSVFVIVLTLTVLIGCKGGDGDAVLSTTGTNVGHNPPSSSNPILGIGTAVLAWTPPTVNTDGSPVDLMGYVIYQGSSAVNLTMVRMVGPLDMNVVIDNLPTGTYYFAVTALSPNGAESAYSNIQSKTIN